MGLTELIAAYVPGCSELPAKRELCRKLADYYSQSAKVLTAEIKPLEEEFGREIKVAKEQGDAITPEYVDAVFDAYTLTLRKLAKLYDEGDAFWYGLRTRLPVLLVFTKKSELEAETAGI